MTSPTLARKAKLKNHLVSAKAKLRQHLTLRRIILVAAASAAAFLLILTLRTLSASHARSPAGAASVSPPVSVRHNAQQQQLQQHQGGCAKLPGAVAEALVHYATANATLRQTGDELAATARVLAKRTPCNVLVFGGLGPESALWAALNHGGRTAFLEEDAASIAEAAARHPGLGLESHQVAYQTTLADADELLGLRGSPDCTASPPKDRALSADHFERSPCKLAMRGLPAAFYETEWDVIIVDAPAGWVPEAPGRVGGAIYMAGMAARARRPGSGETDVLVHGVDRTVEDSFSRAFLCEGYIKEEVGRLRHFAIPSHRENEGMPFCP
ncbi:glucuronoxylan 4-O-methyltransferase 3-like [Lolium rigidum]|uniref:glucuronoxylan 4-O-methyltransferase 3-like n=1 Tax=Lolium rigidum TaxID=89674 RepID=UPI001F5D849A|nr:glucuronoxylan 4-O-methyltransferase 3-like [Lolium rigidum]